MTIFNISFYIERIPIFSYPPISLWKTSHPCKVLVLVTDTYESEAYKMEIYDLKSRKTLLKKDIGSFPDVHCDGQFVLVNFGNKFDVINAKSLESFVLDLDNNYHCIINFEYPHVTTTSNLDYVVWKIDNSKLYKHLYLPLVHNGALPAGHIKGCYIEPNLALVHCSADNTLAFLIISETGDVIKEILWTVDDVPWTQNCYFVSDRNHFVVLSKKRNCDDICAMIIDAQDIATASGNVDLKVSEINVGSSYEFFQTSDRDSRVLLNKDSFHIVGWRNIDSSIYCNTFNFWRTP